MNDRSYRLNKHFAGYRLISSFSTEIGVGLATLVTLIEITRGTATIGDMSLIGGAAGALILSVSGIASSLSAYAKNLYSAKLFIEVVTPPALSTTLKASKIMDQTPEIDVDIKEFGYPPEGEKGDYKSVLKDISFKVKPGKFIAIVGENGHGKSSLINILTGAFEPIAGKILIDGRDLNEIETEKWFSNIGVLSQNFRLIPSLTIRENISLGINPDKENLCIEEAAEMAGLSSLLNGLSKGLDTIYGQGADGQDFSGGEKQKIALARALISMPKILFLDEPTANLDKSAEKKLFDTIKILQHTKGWKPTIIYISHTFARVKKADQIIVIKNGRIETMGVHEELMKDPDCTYYRLFRLDSDAYGSEH